MVLVGAPLRIGLIEPQRLFLRALRNVLSADSGLAVIAELVTFDPRRSDLANAQAVIVDVDFADEAALSILSGNGLHGVMPPLFILSCHFERAWLEKWFRLGAAGFAGKGIEPAELIRGIKSVARGEQYLDPSLAEHLFDAPSPDQLTERETCVLRLIGTGMSNRQIAGNMKLSEKTVKCHASTIFGKLHLEGRTQAALHAVRVGIA